ncbi:MAG: hypothetical protein U0L17_00175 [Acutalibacteraceae bacterium]|nr:hypothetical protein [Acutalibacteraceae bacterium]
MKKRFFVGTILALIICSITAFTSVLAVEPTTVKGDINCDGVCDVNDYKLLKRKVLNLSISGVVDESKFDFDGNGKIEQKDMTAMGVALWDNNGDSSFDKNDYKMIEKYLTNYNNIDFSANWLKKADFDGNGVVDLLDLNGVGNEVYEIWSGRY